LASTCSGLGTLTRRHGLAQEWCHQRSRTSGSRSRRFISSRKSAKATVAKPIVAEKAPEIGSEAQKVVCPFGLADAGVWKQRGETARLREVLTPRYPMVLAVAIVAFVEAVTQRHARKAAKLRSRALT
jgi:hypothetical protein